MRGLHLIADLRGCAAARPVMTTAAVLRSTCLDAVAAAGLTAVGELFHPFVPGAAHADGAPAGITGVVLLAESHLAVHTWPEIGAATIDVYVCNLGADNSARAESLLATLVAAFAPGAVARHAIERGAEPAATSGASFAATSGAAATSASASTSTSTSATSKG